MKKKMMMLQEVPIKSVFPKRKENSMKKNLFILLLLICNIYFVFNGYANNSSKVDLTENQKQEISINEYAELFLLKEILPSKTFESQILPMIKTALADKIITRAEFNDLNEKIKNILFDEEFLFTSNLLKKLEKKDFGSQVNDLIDDVEKGLDVLGQSLEKGAGELGKTLEKGINRFLDENKELLTEENIMKFLKEGSEMFEIEIKTKNNSGNEESTPEIIEENNPVNL